MSCGSGCCCGRGQTHLDTVGGNCCNSAAATAFRDRCGSGAAHCRGPCGGITMNWSSSGRPGNTTTRSGTFRTPGGGGRWTVTESRYDSGWRTHGDNSSSSLSDAIGSSRAHSHGSGGPHSITSSRIYGPASARGSSVSGSGRASVHGTDLGGGWTAEAGSPAAASVRGSSYLSGAASAVSSHQSRASGASSRHSRASSVPRSRVSEARAGTMRSNGSRTSRQPEAGSVYVPRPLSTVAPQRSGSSIMLPGSRIGSRAGQPGGR